MFRHLPTLLALGCFDKSADTAAEDGLDGTFDERTFVTTHSEAICAKEDTILMERPPAEVEDEPLEYAVDDSCVPYLENWYLSNVGGVFLPSVAAGCHAEYLDAPKAPFGDLDWAWCYFAWYTE